jgi:hypothetical protein
MFKFLSRLEVLQKALAKGPAILAREFPCNPQTAYRFGECKLALLKAHLSNHDRPPSLSRSIIDAENKEIRGGKLLVFAIRVKCAWYL